MGAPAAAPGSVFAPASTPLQNVTPPPQTQPMQTAPVTPPGGWSQPAANPYGVQPTSAYTGVGANGTDNSVVRIAPDDQGLRFASVPNNNPNDIMQVAANQQLATSTPFVYTPPAIERQGFPNSASPAQYAATTVAPGTASDGFRPQGSTQQTAAPPSSQPFANQNSALAAEDPSHFGFDPTYSSLRGQLQYYPQTGYWGLRYVSMQGAPDPYGGVVVINNPDVLGGVQPGEFLLIQGFLETQDNGDGTFLPHYTVEGIQRQR